MSNELYQSQAQQQMQNQTRTSAQASEGESRALLPAVDIFEDESGITLLADMPGVPRDALSVQLEGDVLFLEGRVRNSLPKNYTAVYSDLSGDRYARSFTLSKELDAGGITAGIDQGVVRVHIPKAEALKPRKIEVALK